ncbi:MAG: ribonuclease III [Gammaproteobacteria bacterium]|nr:ribonuclease III [Gammaproteobacteria bacterium]
MTEPLHQLYRELGYQFDQSSLLQRALTHRSADESNNERLEFLGDAILGFVIADALYRNYRDANEGQLSRLRARLVKKESLAAIARKLGLGSYLNLGAGELRSGGHARDSILADALEALFAAVYLDSGYQSARKLILKLYHERIDGLSAAMQEKDPKTRLQEYLQSRKVALPDYTILAVSGEQHDQHFDVACQVAELDLITQGSGSSRRKAEQKAAADMLELLLE